MRFPLSMVVLMVAVTGLSTAVVAEEVTRQPLSPIQTQLQKMQEGETYGMKTVTVPQGSATPSSLPKESLNDNAKALADKAQAEARKPPTRLEMIQDAYKKAAPPADTEKPAAEKPAEDKSKEPEDKAAKAKEAAEKSAQQDSQRNEQVMFETMHDGDAPKKPARLIPVN